jgi:hypothetical protein
MDSENREYPKLTFVPPSAAVVTTWVYYLRENRPLHLSLYHRDVDSAIQLVNSGAELHLLWRKVGIRKCIV